MVTSPVAQTTRNTLKGIKTTDAYQIVFIDTPGVHSPKDPMGKLLNNNAMRALYDADVVLMLAPVDEYIGPNDQLMVKKLTKITTPIIMCVTKIDLAKHDDLKNKIAAWQQFGCFKEIIPISSVSDLNLDKLVDAIVKKLPTGPKYYDDECLSDQSEVFFIQELVREKILMIAKEEVPHHIAVLCESINEEEDIVRINAQIIVGRDSQKGIIIGKAGRNIKQIGQFTRLELENYYKKKVYLELHVKMIKN